MSYDYEDWRGLAMLAQQMGNLFSPSKAKLLSMEHEHEATMLAAKQAWTTQTEELSALKKEYSGLLDSIDTETRKVEELGLESLAIASTSDGALGENASEIYDQNDVKKLSDLQEVSAKYEKMILDKQKVLDDMQLYNTTAKVGEQLRKGGMQKKVKGKGVVDYYEMSDVDGITGLSFEEEQNAIKQYIKDNYSVTDGSGMPMQFGSGENIEEIMVRPEAHALRAGWEQGIGSGTGRGRAEKELVSNKQAIEEQKRKLTTGKTRKAMTNEELIEGALYAKRLFEGIDKKNPDAQYPLGLYLDMTENGDFVAKQMAYNLGFERDDVNTYASGYSVFKSFQRELIERGVTLPTKLEQKSDILLKMKAEDNVKQQIMQDFNSYEVNPDSMLTSINQYKPKKQSDPSQQDLYNAYIDFIKRLPTLDAKDRRDGISQFKNLIGQ